MGDAASSVSGSSTNPGPAALARVGKEGSE